MLANLEAVYSKSGVEVKQARKKHSDVLMPQHKPIFRTNEGERHETID